VLASKYRSLQGRSASCSGCWAGRTRCKRRSSRRLLKSPQTRKTVVAVAVVAKGRFPMKTVREVLNVARSNVTVRVKTPLAKSLGRPPQPDADWRSKSKL
jgi:hypothetical protein